MSRGKVTDTELQAGQFVVSRHGSLVADQPESSRYLNNFKETLDEVHVSHRTTFQASSLTRILLLVVPNGVLRKRKEGRQKWPLLSCFWYTSILQHPSRRCVVIIRTTRHRLSYLYPLPHLYSIYSLLHGKALMYFARFQCYVALVRRSPHRLSFRYFRFPAPRQGSR